MTNREKAEHIFEVLNKNGAGIGNMSMLIIEKSLSESNQQEIECEGLSIAEGYRYNQCKESALAVAKKLRNVEFIETMAMIFEASSEISGGRACELMEHLEFLLNCQSVCIKHGLMREAMGLPNNGLQPTPKGAVEKAFTGYNDELELRI